jgi:hypothetical protein
MIHYDSNRLKFGIIRSLYQKVMDAYHLDITKFIWILYGTYTLEKIRKLENSSKLPFCEETFR